MVGDCSFRRGSVRITLVDQIVTPGKQRIDIGVETIGCKAGAGGTADTKSAKERLRAASLCQGTRLL